MLAFFKMMSCVRIAAAGVLVTAAAVLFQPASVSAHRSASYVRGLYTHRYLICDERAMERVKCVGTFARDRVLADLSPGPLEAGRNNSRKVDPARKSAVASVYFNMKEAVPPLKRLLEIQVSDSDREAHIGIDKNALRAEAAYALAHLGDRGSKKKILALIKEFEKHGHGSLWDDTLDALSALDRQAAAKYATDFIGRADRWKWSMPGGTSKSEALRYIERANYTAALPVLRRLTSKKNRAKLGDSTFCQMIGTRVALADEPLRSKLRTRLLGSYGGTWLANCQPQVLAALGEHPDDAAALIRHLGRPDIGLDHGATNIAYRRILHLLVRMRTGKKSSTPERERLRDGLEELERKWPGASTEAKRKKARELIRKGFDERKKWPHVTQPNHRTFSRHFVVYHLLGLAAVGDKRAKTTLFKYIDDPNERSGLAWLAGYWALRLRLPGAKESVAKLMERGVLYDNQIRSGSIFGGLRRRVLNAYSWLYPNDPRWTVMLLDYHVGDTPERALYLMSRIRPKGACKAVVQAAAKAGDKARKESVEFAFWALTAYGNKCQSQLEKVASDGAVAARVRGPALEMIAAMGSGQAAQVLNQVRGDDDMRIYAQRAERIYEAAR